MDAAPSPAPAQPRWSGPSPLFPMWMWLGGALVLAGSWLTLFLAAFATEPDSTDVCVPRESTLGECYLAVHQDHLYVRELSTMSLGLAAASLGCLFVAFMVWLARRP